MVHTESLHRSNVFEPGSQIESCRAGARGDDLLGLGKRKTQTIREWRSERQLRGEEPGKDISCPMRDAG